MCYSSLLSEFSKYPSNIDGSQNDIGDEGLAGAQATCAALYQAHFSQCVFQGFPRDQATSQSVAVDRQTQLVLR